MANSVISLGIEVNGEKTFDNALKAINAQCRAFSAEIKTTSSSLSVFDKGILGTAKNVQSYAQIIQAQGQKMEILKQKLDTAKGALDQMAAALERAKASGNAQAIDQATNAYNNQARVVANLSREMEQTEQNINNAKRALLDIAKGAIASGLEKIKNAAHAMGEGLKKAAEAANELTNKMSDITQKVAVGAVAVFAGLGKVALDYNSQMENYTTNFATLLGSTEAAVMKVEELKKMAASTPFAMNDLAAATQTLLNFQIPAEKTSTILQQLGDISLGNSEKLQSLATVFGQVSSAGRLTGQDLMQFINAGFNPLNEIAKQTGESMEQLRERMSAGGVSVKEVEQAFISATSAGGQFYQGMQSASQTMTGLFSTLKDNVTSLIGSVFQPLTDSIKSKLLPAAIGYIQELTNAFQTQGVSGMIAAATQIMNGILQTVQSQGPQIVQTVFQFIQEMIQSLASVTPQFVQAAAAVIQAFMEGLHNTIPQILPVIQQIAPLIVQTIVSWKSEMLQMGIQIIVAIAEGIAKDVDKTVDAIVQNVQAIVKTITDNIDKFVEAGIQIIIALGKGLIECIPTLVENIPTIIKAIVDGIISHLPDILDVGVQIVKGLWDGICSMISWLWDQVSGWIQGLWDGIKSFFGIASPSKLMRDEIGKNLALGMAEGIIAGSGAVQNAYNSLMPNASSFALSADGYSVAARQAAAGVNNVYQDNRPVILRLNDRELGRAVRGYV